MGGAGYVEGQEKELMVGCCLDDFRAFFGIKADQWITHCSPTRTGGDDARRQNKGRNVPSRNGPLQRKSGLDYGMQYTVVSVAERDAKDQGGGSPKQACSCWFARRS